MSIIKSRRLRQKPTRLLPNRLLSSMQTFKFKKKKSLQTINGFQSRDDTAMLLHKTIANLAHVLHNNTIKFLKDFLLVCSVH